MGDVLDRALLQLAERLKRKARPEPWIATFSPSTGLQMPGADDKPYAVPDRPRFEPQVGEPPELSVDELVELLVLAYNGHVSWRCGCGCERGGWRELRGLAALRDEQQGWVDDMQERADARWRDDPAVQRRAEDEAMEAAERAEQAGRERERAHRNQERADRKFKELVVAGLSPQQAAAEVAKYSKDF